MPFIFVLFVMSEHVTVCGSFVFSNFLSVSLLAFLSLNFFLFCFCFKETMSGSHRSLLVGQSGPLLVFVCGCVCVRVCVCVCVCVFVVV